MRGIDRDGRHQRLDAIEIEALDGSVARRALVGEKRERGSIPPPWPAEAFRASNHIDL